MDSMWLCLCGALVMFMHCGFAMLETGSCRAKNASNVLMKNLVNVTKLKNLMAFRIVFCCCLTLGRQVMDAISCDIYCIDRFD